MLLKFQFQFSIYLFGILELVLHSECLPSATNNSAIIINVVESRKLTDDTESITSHTNSISESNSYVHNEANPSGYQYYKNSAASIQKHEPSIPPVPSSTYPSNHKPVHELDIDQSYFPQVEEMPFISNVPVLPVEHYIQYKNKSPNKLKSGKFKFWSILIFSTAILEYNYYLISISLKITLI